MNKRNVTRKSQFHNPHIDSAHEAGIADGQAGIESGGWEYVGGTLEDSYKLGFLVGMAKREMVHLPVLEVPAEVDSRLRSRVLVEVKRLAGGSEAQPLTDEQAMDAELDAIRNHGKLPIVRLTDAQLCEIEQECW